MPLKPTIMKFGGTSVADAVAFERVAGIVQSHKDTHPVVVVSAMGGFTDVLLHCFDLSVKGQANLALAKLNEQLERHTEVVTRLASEVAASDYKDIIERARRTLRKSFKEAESASTSLPALKDHVVSYGEQLSSETLALVLQSFGIAAVQVDARRIVITDDQHSLANPLMVQTTNRASRELASLIQAGKVPVLGGFIGSTTRGATTTLGRGGSDYSAAILGAALNAREIQIWTDVSGVLTADPRIATEARTVPLLSYREAAELAYFGARVLHPKTIHPAVERDIPVRVCNSHAPHEAGTLVVAESEAAPHTVKAIAHKNGITTLQVTSSRMLGAYGFLRALFEVFDVHRTVVDVVTTSEVSVSLSVDNNATLPALVPDLEKLGSVEVEGRRTIISVIGEGLRTTPGIAGRIFSTLSDINISMISFGASSINLTFMVEEEHGSEAIKRLHRVCFENESDQSVRAKDASSATAKGVCGLSLNTAHARPDVFALTRKLIDISSITGDEGGVARFLARLLESLDYEVELQPLNSDRSNVIARRGEAPAVFLSSHMDTVPPYIAASEDEDFLYGRGACDAKGIIAAQICAAELLHTEGGNEVGLLFTVDEETGSGGAKLANTHPLSATCRYLINGEPTDNRLAIGSKGSLQVTIRTEGRAAHSAYPEQGESAIENLLAVLADVRKIAWPASDTFGETTCNLGVISGGTRANVIAAEARAVFQIRLVTSADPVKQLLEQTVAGRAAIEFGSIHDPQQMLAVDGFEQTIVRFTTDIPYLSNWGVPLLLGPGSILDAHAATERIRKSDLLDAVDLYCRLSRVLLNR